MRIDRPKWFVAAVAAFVVLFCAVSGAQTLNDKLWSGMEWRQIGPFRGGRVLAVTGVVGQPDVYYFGAVSGGVWKTTDGGLTWLPMTDKEPFASIGAIAVAPSDPNVIYVGTGESCLRGNISYGNGMYKSLDAGKTWTHIGLDDSRHIASVIVDPRDPNVVLVAAMGHAFGPNSERGVFRSTDGGKTWAKVLYKDENTGATDLVFDPSNSNVVFAAMYQARRLPWDFISGGPGSGLYRSADGGVTWTELTGHGLPSGILGKIGMAVSGADSNRVYALIEAKEGGLYRSDDGGENWKLINSDHKFRQRAWYFTHIFADPQSKSTVYILNTGLFRSTDSGKSFDRVPAPHGDHHGLWIDPRNPKRMINGNDGGATITTDGGETWTTQNNQPTAQFYHVTTDNRFLYWVYGAQQDNSTVGIASRTSTGEISDKDWKDVGGGESGYIAVDPRDPNIVYAGDNGGTITRRDMRTLQTQDITVWPEDYSGYGAGQLRHRFQWTAPIVLSPSDPDTLYIGGEKLFKTTDGGHSWTAISPDLTRNDKSKQQSAGGPITKDNTSVEYYDTIFTIAESPLKRGQIWVGTDDGLIQLTEDGGAHWSNVTPKAMPAWSMVSLIEASPLDAGTAYAAIDRHKLDDFAPYIFITHDYGKTWSRMNSGIPEGSYVHVVRSDTQRKGLLFAGTETGVYVSFDDGAQWQTLQLNLPDVPVHDLAVKNADLVAATHGRAFWILDDITPLRDANASLASHDVYLYAPMKSVRYRTGGTVPKRYLSHVGQNASGGVTIDYYLAKAPEKPIMLEILDSKGDILRKYTSKKPEHPEAKQQEWDEPETEEQIPAEEGMNRYVWDLRIQGPRRVPGVVYDGGDQPDGPWVVPGTYQVRLIAESQTLTESVQVTLDPRLKTSKADLQKQFDLASKVEASLNRANDAVRQMDDVRRQLEALQKRLAGDSSAKAILAQANALEDKMSPVENALNNKNIQSTEDSLNYPVRLNNKLSVLGEVIESADTAPTEQSYELFDYLDKQAAEQVNAWDGLKSKDLTALNEAIRKQNIPAIAPAPAKPE